MQSIITIKNAYLIISNLAYTSETKKLPPFNGGNFQICFIQATDNLVNLIHVCYCVGGNLTDYNYKTE